MARAINKFDAIRNIAYISYDSISELYTVWYKTTKTPLTLTKDKLNKTAKEYIKHSHSYSYGVSTYYRTER